MPYFAFAVNEHRNVQQSKSGPRLIDRLIDRDEASSPALGRAYRIDQPQFILLLPFTRFYNALGLYTEAPEVLRLKIKAPKVRDNGVPGHHEL